VNELNRQTKNVQAFFLFSCFLLAVFIARFLVALFAFFFATAVAISPIVIGVLSDMSREPPETDFFAMILSLCRGQLRAINLN
jgi:di/tricarboxylate transporter